MAWRTQALGAQASRLHWTHPPGVQAGLLCEALRRLAKQRRLRSQAQFRGHTTYFPWTAPLGKISGAEPADSKRSTTAEGSCFAAKECCFAE